VSAPGERSALEEHFTDPRDRHIDGPDVLFLLWSFKHGQWWASGDVGYTSRVAEAQRYRLEDAAWRCQRSALAGRLSHVTAMVAAPDNWGLADYPDAQPVTRRLPGMTVHGSPHLVDVLADYLADADPDKGKP
jgi:hypothetical protein